jgi:RNA polymerase sigma factor (TIGR02999 family)
MPGTKPVTALLLAWGRGEEGAEERLFELVYHELRRRAAAQLRRERGSHTLQPTALVHEAFMRLVDHGSIPWQGRAHFFAVASRTMRRVLVDHARRRLARRRGGGATRITLDDAGAVSQPRDVDLLALDGALERLAALDPRQSQIVELRYFGGLSVDETAQVLRVSSPTVKRGWTTARAWLFRELQA